MRTSELIDLMAEDLRPEPSLNNLLIQALIAGIMTTAIVFFLQIGFRKDIASAISDGRFLFKFVVTLTLALPSAAMLFRMAQPGVSPWPVMPMLLVSPILLLAAAATELRVMPSETWAVRAIGHNALACLTIIPLLAAVPLACLMYGMRHGAPDEPGTAGMTAGLASAGISATFYAANCNDDSPLFVLLWYPVAVAIVALAGYLAGSRLLRW